MPSQLKLLTNDIDWVQIDYEARNLTYKSIEQVFL